jgi:hypothetical protein
MMMRRTLLSAAILLLVTLAAVAAAGLLDGRTFVGEMGEKGKEKGDEETFVFKDGRFDPIACHQYGFGPAPYTAKAEGNEVHFEAVTKSDEEGAMQWQGTVQGAAISGTVLWTKQGQAPIEYWFKGQLTHKP